MFCRTSQFISSQLFYNINKHNLKHLLQCNNTQRYCKYSTIQNIDKNIIENYVKHLENEHRKLSERKTLDNASTKYLQDLSSVMQIINERNRMAQHLVNLNELLEDNDEELKKLAVDEKKAYEEKLNDIEQDLLESLIPVDVQDLCDSVVLEVNAGVGGQEAMLFAHELFDMYMNFAEYKGWSSEVAEFDSTDLGGLRHASVFVNGSGVFRYFKYEAGVHRVQRIPATERAGRVHTSTVSVVCLPQPKDVDVTINDKDLRIETKRASGAGGQHVNTTDSAVRIVHLPTGVAVECQVDRSQIKNREIAMQRLRAKLYEQQLVAQMEENEATRKSQVRSNFRNEKIRTYNFSQDRITDHRLQSSNMHNMKGFLLGGEQLEILIDKLHSAAQYENLMRVLNSVKSS